MDDQTLAPTPQDNQATIPPAKAAPPLAETDSDDGLTPLDPAYKTVVRISMAITCIPFLIGALVLESAQIAPQALIITPVTLLALLAIFRIPARRYLARGYDMGADRLRIVRGILFRADTVVPFGRVQHIDVNQGPLERFFDIATLSLHTAGSHGAHVQLPGLKHAVAMEMREEIRSHIKREMV